MIKPEELRIGNLVYIPSTKQMVPVTVINEFLGVWVNRSLGVLGFDQIEPIPLSEEWLLKLGYDIIRTNDIQHKEYHNRKINEGAYYVEKVGDAHNHWYLYHKNKMITSNIRFVHQLQNLVHSLTGEELTVKN